MHPVFKTVVVLSLLFVNGCTPFWRTWMRDGHGASAMSSAMPKHESWCYTTLGAIECYPGPQRLPPESLVSVDPPSRQPLTRADHANALTAYSLEHKK